MIGLAERLWLVGFQGIRRSGRTLRVPPWGQASLQLPEPVLAYAFRRRLDRAVEQWLASGAWFAVPGVGALPGRAALAG